FAAADFNGDGRADLAAASIPSGEVVVLLNDGEGSFNAPSRYVVGTSPRDLIAADFNGDGRADLATILANSFSVLVLFATDFGTFGEPVPAAFGAIWPNAITASDLNGDGPLDIAIANSTRDVSVYLGKGDGTFTRLPLFPLGIEP